MNKRKRYFIKQKLIGVTMIIFALISCHLTKEAFTALIITPIALVMIFSKKMIWMDSYFYEIQKMKKKS